MTGSPSPLRARVQGFASQYGDPFAPRVVAALQLTPCAAV